jgi:hypothetical protein
LVSFVEKPLKFFWLKRWLLLLRQFFKHSEAKVERLSLQSSQFLPSSAHFVKRACRATHSDQDFAETGETALGQPVFRRVMCGEAFQERLWTMQQYTDFGSAGAANFTQGETSRT